MKKTLLLGAACLLGLSSMAEDMKTPVIVPDGYATKITPDGKWMGCYGFSALIYNIETNESRFVNESVLGLGNSLTLKGVGVGHCNDYAVIMEGTEGIVPEPLRAFGPSTINAITPDGTRFTGYVTNPEADDLDSFNDKLINYLPYYCDIDATGKVGPVNILPYPEEDFFGGIPQYIRGMWISEDGKTILGVLTDSFGKMDIPLVYTQDENGKWSYDTPSKKLFNPEGVEIPSNPWVKAPEEPQLKDFMDPEYYEIYMEWLNEYLTGQDVEEPDPMEFMDEEEIEAYENAWDEYNNFFIDYRDELRAFDDAYVKVMSTSPIFSEMTMNLAGTKIAAPSYIYDEDSTSPSIVYIFDLITGEYVRVNSKYPGLNATQLLSDGTVLARTGMFSYEAAQTYILLPGASDFINIRDYFSQSHPSFIPWMDANIPKNSGLVAASENLETFAGGLEFVSLADPNLYPDSTVLSYIFEGTAADGVETVGIEDASEYLIFNLQGLKVMQTKDREEIRNLPKGIYIVNGKKIAF